MPLKYVEDWLECMYGKIDLEGQAIVNKRLGWPNPEAPIKLATYDKRFVESTVQNLSKNQGLTDKQILLAVKIITKYKRQWSALSLDPSYLETEDVPLRLPMRQVDRTTSIKKEGNSIRLRFPYNSGLITEMHTIRGQSYGNWLYERDSKSWIIDLTEGNIRTLARMEEFKNLDWQMDDDLKSLFELVNECLTKPRKVPTMDLVYGETIFRDIPDKAMESFQSSRHGDITVDALIAIKHGIELGQGIKNLHHSDHPINSLLDKDTWDMSHNRYHSRSDISEIMKLLPDVEFTFITNESRNRNLKFNLVDEFMDLTNEKTYLDSAKELIGMNPSLYDTKKNILVINVSTTSPGELVYIEDQFLGVLHMNVDDERRWQPAS